MPEQFPEPRDGFVTLATVVMDETAYMEDLPDGVERVQSVYLFRAREAVHIASFQANSECHFLETIIHGGDPESNEHNELKEELERESREHNGGVDYFNYIDVDRIESARVARVGTYSTRDMIRRVRDAEDSGLARAYDDARGDPDRYRTLVERFTDAMVEEHGRNALPDPVAVSSPTVANILDKVREGSHLTGAAETRDYLLAHV